MSDNLMGKDAALTEAIGVQSVAKGLTEMGEAPADESLQMASELLDQLRVEAPGTADLMIESANLWKQIEIQVDEKQLGVLLKSSKSIASTDQGRQLMRSLGSIIGDKESTIDKTKAIFEGNQDLKNILDSKPGLSDLWYDHLYLTFKSAVVVVEGGRSGELP